METNKEVKELEGRLNQKPKPIESPIVSLIKYFKSKKKRKKLEEIEYLKLEIERAKLKKELEKLDSDSKPKTK